MTKHSVVTIDTRVLSKFKYIINITGIIRHPNQLSVYSTRYIELHDWLAENVGIENYNLGYYSDLDNERESWVLAVNREEDILAFRLKFKNLDKL